MKKFFVVWLTGMLFTLAGSAFASSAGEIIIVGSDVVSNHGDQIPFSIALFNDLSEFSTKPILVLNDFGGGGPGYVGGTGFDFRPSLAGVTLSNYSAIWLASPGRCCGDFSIYLSAADAAAILSFHLSGGSIGIENFLGGGPCSVGGTDLAVWTMIFQFDPSPGIIGSGCNNAIDLYQAFATPQGLADEFPAYGYENIWNHQVYDPTFWTNHNFIPIMTAGDASHGEWNVLEENTPEPLPEPSSLVMLCTGIVGLVSTVRRGISP